MDMSFLLNKNYFIRNFDFVIKMENVDITKSINYNSYINSFSIIDFSYLNKGFIDVFLQDNKKISNFFFLILLKL